MSSGQVTVGVLLVLPIASVAVESLGWRRSPFARSAFWQLPLGDKLDHIAQHTRAWWLMHLPWIATLGVTKAGLAGHVASLFVAESVDR